MSCRIITLSQTKDDAATSIGPTETWVKFSEHEFRHVHDSIHLVQVTMHYKTRKETVEIVALSPEAMDRLVAEYRKEKRRLKAKREWVKYAEEAIARFKESYARRHC